MGEIQSPLIDKAAPHFSLPSLFEPGQQLSQEIFKDKITLLNVWSSWCHSCLYEHSFLLQLKGQPQLQLIGLNYKDQPHDALRWLKQHGDPYEKVVVDWDGAVAIDYGVYGTPETYVIDQQGIIRYKYAGVLDKTIWQNHINPLLERLKHDTIS